MIICAFLLVALQCIVQSYLQWLQDSDYNPNCSLCNDPLIAQDTVRLVCYGEIINLICIDSSCKMSTANAMKNDFAHLEPCHVAFFFPDPDVFHWSCLNTLASRLPLHTAPAGYQCPVCQGPVFPSPNLASPIADQLREQLSSVNWARAGLGLPLVSTCWKKNDCFSIDYKMYKCIYQSIYCKNYNPR